MIPDPDPIALSRLTAFMEGLFGAVPDHPSGRTLVLVEKPGGSGFLLSGPGGEFLAHAGLDPQMVEEARVRRGG